MKMSYITDADGGKTFTLQWPLLKKGWEVQSEKGIWAYGRAWFALQIKFKPLQITTSISVPNPERTLPDGYHEPDIKL
jgi:hypothetical protein